MPPLNNAHQLERRARTIVESLQGTWRRGKGMCCCPAHDDRTPSLSVTLGRKAILFHCFSGCPNEDVIAALDRLGVRSCDLFNSQAARRSVTISGPLRPAANMKPKWPRSWLPRVKLSKLRFIGTPILGG